MKEKARAKPENEHYPEYVAISDWVDRARRARSFFNEYNFGLLVVSTTLLDPIKEAMGDHPNMHKVVGFISSDNLTGYPLSGTNFKATAEFLNANILAQTQEVKDIATTTETSEKKVGITTRILKAITSLMALHSESSNAASTPQSDSISLPIPDVGIVYQITMIEGGTNHEEGSIKAQIAGGRGVILRRVNLADLSPESRTKMSFLINPLHRASAIANE